MTDVMSARTGEDTMMAYEPPRPMMAAPYYSDSSSESDGQHDVDPDKIEANVDLDAASVDSFQAAASDEELDAPPRKDPAIMTSRAYQREMFEECLRRNVIVAMDTGTGKTQVAVLRIAAELERAPSDKIIWFVAPKVELCEQQHEVLAVQLSSVKAQMRLLTGSDGVDSWSKQTWEQILVDIRVVVSTPQVLKDALAHAFLKLESLALLVFDEAHNCVGKSPGSRIMVEHYWPQKEKGLPIPSIMGLTASPSLGSTKHIETLERTLDAICRSPTKHRDELLSHTKRPDILSVYFESPLVPATTDSMLSLEKAYRALDIRDDPCVKQLKLQVQAGGNEKVRQKLGEALDKHNTYVQRQMKTFFQRSKGILRDLGSWSADHYIDEVITRLLIPPSKERGLVATATDPEMDFLAGVLSRVQRRTPELALDPEALSSKLRKVIEILEGFEGEPRGIVFVKERYTVSILHHLLNRHPRLRDRYGDKVGAMFGTSNIPGKKQDFLDLTDVKLLSLDKFRSGKANLLVTTNVLEEGIDVPECNLVVCVDIPPDLRSFIQRRGRARMRDSKLYIMFEKDKAIQKSVRDFSNLEEEMKRQYEDDLRQIQELKALEESEPLTGDFAPLVSKNGAQLRIDDAKGHLQHFCATLTSRRYVDVQPDYIYQKSESEDVSEKGKAAITAVVLLPASLPPDLRRTESSTAWVSEKNASKDAAFQAYKKVYAAGLLGEDLLPIRPTGDDSSQARPGKKPARNQLDPWHEAAGASLNRSSLSRKHLRLLAEDDTEILRLEVALPLSFPDIPPFKLYWSQAKYWVLDMSTDSTLPDGTPLQSSRDGSDITTALLAMSWGHRIPQFLQEDGHLVRFISTDSGLQMSHMSSLDFDAALISADDEQRALVRDASQYPYLYEGRLPSKPPKESIQKAYNGFEEDPEDVPYLIVRKLPRRAGFFRHPGQQVGQASTKPYPRVIPELGCKMDNVPLIMAQFGMMIPAIIHILEIYLVASDLSRNLLDEVAISQLQLVATAITTSSVRAPMDYERIEFLGDSVLKFCTTLQCVAEKPYYTEGYLSALKDTIVSNSRLCKACQESGLDQYIITKELTTDKWRPKYVSDYVDAMETEATLRDMPTKTMADVIESLIGAACIDGGLEDAGINKALACIRLFLPDISWIQSLEEGRSILYNRAPSHSVLDPTHAPVESLLGYTFQKKSLLLEALTHSSFTLPSAGACLEQLEFLGDAVLDHVVVTALFRATPEMANFDMHLYRAALVNGDFLAFLVMEWHVTQGRTRIAAAPDPSCGKEVQPQLAREEVEVPLWRFLRHSNAELGLAQGATERRHAALRARIWEAVERGDAYPWALLARLQAHKFYSDMFESVLGAVWIDSGSAAACEALVERAGITPYLRRMLADGVRVKHPKEELGIVAGNLKVRYDMDKRAYEGPDEERDVEHLCRVVVGDEVVVEVDDGVSGAEVRTRAAEEALKVLKGRRGAAARE